MTTHFSDYGTGTSVKSGRVKLVWWLLKKQTRTYIMKG